MSATEFSFTLNNGLKIPAVGLGCWMGSPGEEERAYEMCKKAIKIGYRAFDTASGYQDESAVGRAIRDSGIPRSEFFVTTKLGSTHHDRVREAFDESFAKLGLDYIDLYLVHWPQATPEALAGATPSEEESPTVVDTWAQMEKLLDTDKVRSIGVSNYSIKILERLLPHVQVTPAVNQVELHPCLPQFELQEYCKSKGIHVTAYSSLGANWSPKQADTPNLLRNDTVEKLAQKHGATTGQILISWAVQRGVNAIPKSEDEDRLRKNFTPVKLSDEDMQLLNDLHKQPGMHRSLLFMSGQVAGWTFEQLGWNFSPDGQVLQA